jgi:hypothetical protein
VLPSALLVATVVVHAGCMLGALHAFRGLHAERWGLRSQSLKITLVAGLALMMFYASLLEAWIWASAYLAVGAFSDLEPALYFSIVTFTTLGYGDITLPEKWRLLTSFEAANGIIMFGWTTALVVAFVHRVYTHRAADDPGT